MYKKGEIFLELDNYQINVDTLAIIPIGKNKSKVYEGKDVLIVNQSSFKIISESCLFFGSSYEGRRHAVRNLLGVDMKIPIIIEESRNIVFFPTSSCVRNNSIWISYQNLLKYVKFNDISTTLYFKNSKSIRVGCKYNLIDNQIIRCIKLEKLLFDRKKFVDKEYLIMNHQWE